MLVGGDIITFDDVGRQRQETHAWITKTGVLFKIVDCQDYFDHLNSTIDHVVDHKRYVNLLHPISSSPSSDLLFTRVLHPLGTLLIIEMLLGLKLTMLIGKRLVVIDTGLPGWRSDVLDSVGILKNVDDFFEGFAGYTKVSACSRCVWG